jgi:hypothetical protein
MISLKINIPIEIDKIISASDGTLNDFLRSLIRLISAESGYKLSALEIKELIAKAKSVYAKNLEYSLNTLNKNLEQLPIFDLTITEQIRNMLRANVNLLYQNIQGARLSYQISKNIEQEFKRNIYKKAGFRRMWISSRDELVRPDHVDADGQQEDEAGYFNVGGERLTAPSLGVVIENNINCRCETFPIRISEN